jgi:hypothetical protein
MGDNSMRLVALAVVDRADRKSIGRVAKPFDLYYRNIGVDYRNSLATSEMHKNGR